MKNHAGIYLDDQEWKLIGELNRSINLFRALSRKYLKDTPFDDRFVCVVKADDYARYLQDRLDEIKIAAGLIDKGHEKTDAYKAAMQKGCTRIAVDWEWVAQINLLNYAETFDFTHQDELEEFVRFIDENFGDVSIDAARDLAQGRKTFDEFWNCIDWVPEPEVSEDDLNRLYQKDFV